MNSALALSVLGASLVGSLHCAAMCGGLVGLYSGQGGQRRWPHLAYHAGRLGVYLALGALAGLLGRSLDLAGEAAGLGRLAGLVAGSLLVAWALALLLQVAGQRLPRWPGLSPLKRPLAALMARVSKLSPVQRALGIGLLTGLLPCGLLYSVLLASASTGSVAGGALVTAALWAGTSPILLALGLGAQRLGAQLRQRAPLLTALALLVMGLSSVLLRVPFTPTPLHAGAPESCHAH